jgi:hypothetical protein
VAGAGCRTTTAMQPEPGRGRGAEVGQGDRCGRKEEERAYGPCSCGPWTDLRRDSTLGRPVSLACSLLLLACGLCSRQKEKKRKKHHGASGTSHVITTRILPSTETVRRFP